MVGSGDPTAGIESWAPGDPVARRALADALEHGWPIGAGVDAAQAMRAALRDVWRLAERWRAGNDVGTGAYAEIREAIRGEDR